MYDKFRFCTVPAVKFDGRGIMVCFDGGGIMERGLTQTPQALVSLKHLFNATA